MRIYVASSWRNPTQPAVVEALRTAGHSVFDFRHPKPGNDGFKWSDIDPSWQEWTPEQFRHQLHHPIANQGFGIDFRAMEQASAGVLVLPAGRSAHLEAGYFVGARKPLFILLSDGEPELMYKMAAGICTTLEELIDMLKPGAER
jgi:nucleoside 2-deoxyribosyltransferase